MLLLVEREKNRQGPKTTTHRENLLLGLPLAPVRLVPPQKKPFPAERKGLVDVHFGCASWSRAVRISLASSSGSCLKATWSTAWVPIWVCLSLGDPRPKFVFCFCFVGVHSKQTKKGCPQKAPPPHFEWGPNRRREEILIEPLRAPT